jgi:hypothetical protein
MRVEDLHHNELLKLDSEGGVIRFAGQRARWDRSSPSTAEQLGIGLATLF